MLHSITGFQIIGHRGYGPTPASMKSNENNTLLPENSLAAFAHAVKTGADGIECDVFLSADHIPMVIHDDEIAEHVIPAMAGAAAGIRVATSPATELQRFDIGAGEKIPTLAALLDLVTTVATRPLIINLDIKDPACIAATTALIGQHPARRQGHHVIVSSYDWDILRAFRRTADGLTPPLPLALAPAIKSKILFGAENLGPGYVPLVEHYRPEARHVLESLADDIGLVAYDTTTTDYKPALATWAAARGLGLQISTANARVAAAESDYTVLRQLKDLATRGVLPFVIVKVDEPDKIRTALA